MSDTQARTRRSGDGTEAGMGETFGQRLRHLRTERGMTLRGLAEGAGISAPYVSDIERGNRNCPSWGVVEKMAATLCVSIADLNPIVYRAALSAGERAALSNILNFLHVAMGHADLHPSEWMVDTDLDVLRELAGR